MSSFAKAESSAAHYSWSSELGLLLPPVKQYWCLQSSLSASAPVADQQQHHTPQISPLAILRLKSEEMTEICGRNRGSLMLEEAQKVGRFYVYSAM